MENILSLSVDTARSFEKRHFLMELYSSTPEHEF